MTYIRCRSCKINTRLAMLCSCGFCPLCCFQKCPEASCEKHIPGASPETVALADTTLRHYQELMAWEEGNDLE